MEYVCVQLLEISPLLGIGTRSLCLKLIQCSAANQYCVLTCAWLQGDLCDRDSIVTIARGSVCTLSNTVTRLLAREHPVYTEPETKVSDTVYEREACSPSVDAEKMFGEANGKICETDWNVSVESRGLKFKSGETFCESMNGESKLNSDESNVKDHPMLRVDEASKQSTLMCLGGFLMALLVLYLFPLPS